MSAIIEAQPQVDAQSRVFQSAARMYQTHLALDTQCYRRSSQFMQEVSADPLTDVSFQFARAVADHKKGESDDAIQEAVERIVDTIRPEEDRSYAETTLLHAGVLMSGRTELLSQPFERSLYVSAVRRALAARNLIRKSASGRKVEPFRLITVTSAFSALMNQDGVVMAPLPHMLIDDRINPHSGALLRSGAAVLNAPITYDAERPCGGFTPGHSADPEHDAFMKKHPRRTRILSACCDLSLVGDGRQEVRHIIDCLEADISGGISPSDKGVLLALGQRITNTVVNDQARRGTRQVNGYSAGRH